jgi:transposase
MLRMRVSWAQVWDILPIVMEKAHYLLPRQRCSCGRTTTATPPLGTAGTVTYGPNINAAAILLASEGNVPLERTTLLMASLLGTPVSTGFVPVPCNASPSAWLRPDSMTQ